MAVPGFSAPPQDPTCLSCGATWGADPTAVLAQEHGHEPEEKLSQRLSAAVGSYQTAQLGGDRAAAKAFLANVISFARLLLTRD